MKITDISAQVKNADRVNVSVDGTYRFSLDSYQVGEIGIKIGKEYTENELREIESESQFGKLYSRALEYSLSRPHSEKEIRDYLWRKTRDTKYKARNGGIKERKGDTKLNADRVFNRLVERGYVSDESFARWWVTNRNQTKGSSRRKLEAELRAKGVNASVIATELATTDRNDHDELLKVIAKKRSRYDDQKLIAYLIRQGFSYDDVKSAINGEDS